MFIYLKWFVDPCHIWTMILCPRQAVNLFQCHDFCFTRVFWSSLNQCFVCHRLSQLKSADVRAVRKDSVTRQTLALIVIFALKTLIFGAKIQIIWFWVFFNFELFEFLHLLRFSGFFILFLWLKWILIWNSRTFATSSSLQLSLSFEFLSMKTEEFYIWIKKTEQKVSPCQKSQKKVSKSVRNRTFAIFGIFVFFVFWFLARV